MGEAEHGLDAMEKIREVAATPDEVEAIRQARKDIANGDLFSHEQVWV